MDNQITRALSPRRNAKISHEVTDLKDQLLEIKESVSLAQTRSISLYPFNNVLTGFTPVDDYGQGAYQKLNELYTGMHSTGLELGALFAQPITEYYTAFEMGILPQVIVRQKNKTGGGKSVVEEMSQFSNDYFHEQHDVLIDTALGKNLFGDSYIAFGLDRNLECITPYPASSSPGFNLFNNHLHNFITKIQRIVQMPDGSKEKVTIIRQFDGAQVLYQAEPENPQINLSDFTQSPKIAQPHMMGECPVVLLANNRKSGSTFGYSQFANVVPFMSIYHQVMLRGFEAQQYMGKPILAITGIPGNVALWLKKTFGIDVTKKTETNTQTSMMEFYKTHKFFAFADQVKAEFIESKYPLGATQEVCKLAFDCIVMMSGVPQFMFGTMMEGSNATVREQYVPIKARLQRKQANWTPALRKIVKWALLGFSTGTTDPVTGTPQVNYGFLTDPTKFDDYTIDIVWPAFLNSDELVHLDVMTLLQNAGSISRLGLAEQYPQYITDAQREIDRIALEAPINNGTTSGTKNSNVGNVGNRARLKAQRAIDDKGNSGNNSGRTAPVPANGKGN